MRYSLLLFLFLYSCTNHPYEKFTVLQWDSLRQDFILKKDIDSVEFSCDQILKLSPQYKSALISKAKILYSKNKSAEAKDLLKASKDPDEDIHLLLAALNHQSQDTVLTQLHLDKAYNIIENKLANAGMRQKKSYETSLALISILNENSTQQALSKLSSPPSDLQAKLFSKSTNELWQSILEL